MCRVMASMASAWRSLSCRMSSLTRDKPKQFTWRIRSRNVPVRHGGVAHLDETLVARHERLHQLFLGDEDRVVFGVKRFALAADHLLEGLAGVVELIANFREHDAVGFLHGDGSPEILVVALACASRRRRRRCGSRASSCARS